MGRNFGGINGKSDGFESYTVSIPFPVPLNLIPSFFHSVATPAFKTTSVSTILTHSYRFPGNHSSTLALFILHSSQTTSSTLNLSVRRQIMFSPFSSPRCLNLSTSHLSNLSPLAIVPTLHLQISSAYYTTSPSLPQKRATRRRHTRTLGV